MKIRKILPLAFIAVGAAILLSGCDAMLDAIFSKNQITVDVPVNAFNHANYAYVSVTVTVTDIATGQQYKESEAWGSYDLSTGTAHYYFSKFRNLPNDTYQINAYYPGLYADPPASQSFFYDPATGAVTTQVTMPEANPGDSTGHSAAIQMLPIN